ncbi:DNA polymerase III subunit tau, partial [Dysosmobacter welbionis]
HGHGHAVLQVPVQPGLGPVRLLKVVEELLGGGGELQLLGYAPEGGPVGLDLLHGGGLAVREFHKHRGHVTVLAGHPEALGGDGGAVGPDDLPVLHAAPQLQRLLLALLLLAAYVGDAVVHHLRPALEGLAGAGDGLIGADQDFVQAVLLQGVQGRDVALERTVALHGDEAPAGAQALALGLDHRQMVRVDLRDYHGYIVGPPVGGVVGDDGALQSRVFLLQGPDLLFLHVHGAEAEIHHGGQPLRVLLRVQDHQIFGLLRHGDVQGPAARHRLGVRFAGAACAGGDG